jgi:hypothetical protein
MKTKEQIAKYNKEYFTRPEVIARAKIRNAERRNKRKEYKKTERGKEAQKRYQATDKYKIVNKSYRLKKLYNLTIEQYDEMISNRNGRCDICGIISKTKLHVDHCHATNRVRGLLCGSCNRALGLMKDNTQFLNNAIQYLLK